MKIYSDLHIHSRFSRATSSKLNLENLEKYARIKGLNLLGTGDFSHPKWLEEIKSNLIEDNSGILKSKTGFNFVLSSEISLMYTKNKRGRRIHIVMLAPDIETVEKINTYLRTLGRLDYDGRPIFGRSAEEVVQSLKQISDKIEIFPAHIWTPWFGVLGEKSGFDSIKEAFGEQEKYIYAIEMGLSSNPKMNWMLSSLDKYTLLANSDSHSFWPWRLGREATIFDLSEITYDNLIKAIRTREGYVGTLGVDPSYGKYHFDGHRNCNFSCTPYKTKELHGLCPICRNPLTIGVLSRVLELSDRQEGFILRKKEQHYNLLPLSEVISLSLGVGVTSKKTNIIYEKLVSGTTEYYVLFDMDKQELVKRSNIEIADLILRNREERLKVKPGYDGEYGKPILDLTHIKEQIKENPIKKQSSIFDF